MCDRLKNLPFGSPGRAHNPLNSPTLQIPTVEPNTYFSSPTYTFRVPSPTESEEEEVRRFENQEGGSNISDHSSRSDILDSPLSTDPVLAGNLSEHLSLLGDSTSLFSPNTSLEISPQPLPRAKLHHGPAETRNTLSTSFKFGLFPVSQDRPTPISRQRRKFSGNQKKKSHKMVVEREPPKTANLSPRKSNQRAYGDVKPPEFGKPSPLQNRLKSSVFNIPKPQQSRPEHHRAEPDGPSYLQNEKGAVSGFVNPFEPRRPPQQRLTPDVVEIPKPAKHPAWAAHRSVQPTFSSFAPHSVGFSAINSNDKIGNFIDLTSSVNHFNQANAFYDGEFAAADPYTYIDSGKATENIKALLEGAFEDEDDKRATRSRKKKVEAAVSGLADQLNILNVEKASQKQSDEEDGNDDEDDGDDGTVEGLNVKLLPHQVDGVEWMTEKEIRVKKKNGILPKGGILADDVSLFVKHETITKHEFRWVLVKLYNPSPSF